MIVWTKNAPISANQLWTVNSDGSIASKLNGYVLDISGANPTRGIQLIVWPKNAPSTTNQQWKLLDKGSGYVAIQSRLQNYLLDIQGANAARGTPVIDWPQNNPITNNQLWHLAQAPAANCAAPVQSAQVNDQNMMPGAMPTDPVLPPQDATQDKQIFLPLVNR